MGWKPATIVQRLTVPVLIGALGAPLARTAQAVHVYVGPPGDSWFAPAHWDVGTVPGATSDVLLALPVVVDGAGAVAGNILVAEDGCLTVTTGTLAVGGSVVVQDAGCLVVTEGTLATDELDVQAGGTMAMLDPPARLDGGGIQINSQAMNAWLAGQINLTGGAWQPGVTTMTLSSAHTLGGTGTLQANLVNGGTLSPGQSAGSLTVNGWFAQQSGGSLQIELGGTAAGTGHDELVVSGSAALGGTLSLTTIGGFVPQPGDEFVVLTANSLSGAFATLQLGGAVPGNTEIVYGPDRLTVRVPGGDGPDLMGEAPGDRYGLAAAAIGDVDGDGGIDFAISSPQWDGSRGRVYVYSSLTQTLLWTRQGQAPGDQLGLAMAGGVDLNQDGVGDLIVGAPYNDQRGMDAGAVFVYSGSTGAVLSARLGMAAGDRFGWSVAGDADVNGDGRNDIVIGAPYSDETGVDAGSAWVFSGLNGAFLKRLLGIQAGELFGFSCAGVGRFNGDTYDDLAIGAPMNDGWWTDAGIVYVYAGTTWQLASARRGIWPHDWMGYRVAGAGDFNDDGFDDLAVAAPLQDAPGAPDAGRLYVFSGGQSVLLMVKAGQVNSRFGAWLAGSADVDCDGLPDLIVGDPLYDRAGVGIDSGRVRVISSATGMNADKYFGTTAGARFGAAVALVGDLNGNGRNEYLITAPREGPAQEGAAAAWDSSHNCNAAQAVLGWPDDEPPPAAPGMAELSGGDATLPDDLADAMLEVMLQWGLCPDSPDPCPADLNRDGVVDELDALLVLE